MGSIIDLLLGLGLPDILRLVAHGLNPFDAPTADFPTDGGPPKCVNVNGQAVIGLVQK